MLDAGTLGGELAAMVKAQFGPVLDRIEQRMGALERRIDAFPQPKDGKDADPASVAALVAFEMKADLDQIRALIPAAAEPLPDIKAMVAEAVAEIPAPADGKDGASVTADDVLPALEAQVKQYLEAIPAPTDGKDGRDADPVELPDIDSMVKAAVTNAVKEIPQPKDGLGLACSLIDREGNLVMTMTNGETRTLGTVVGKDAMPGQPGKDGVDGVGFDDLDLSYDGERTFTFTFQKGEREVIKTFTAPVMLDRGVFKAGSNYTKGDAVTYGGSVWVAQGETSDKPGTSAGWRLAVKAGRDGRDGVVKAAPEAKPITLRGGKDAG